MAGRPAGSKNVRTLEFLILYDQLVESLKINPVEVLFRLCRNRDPNIRSRAAGALVNKRFPQQLAVSAVSEGETREFEFTWRDRPADNSDRLPAESASDGSSRPN